MTCPFCESYGSKVMESDTEVFEREMFECNNSECRMTFFKTWMRK